MSSESEQREQGLAPQLRPASSPTVVCQEGDGQKDSPLLDAANVSFTHLLLRMCFLELIRNPDLEKIAFMLYCLMLQQGEGRSQ